MLLGRILLPNCKSSKLIMVTQMVPNTRENKELYAWVANQRRYMYYKEYQGEENRRIFHVPMKE